MRIAIFGSTASKPDNVVGREVPRTGDFEEFCRRLGAMLATAGHSILVESDRSRSADCAVVEGFVSRGPVGASISVYHRTRRREEAPFSYKYSNHGHLFRWIPLSEGILGSAHLEMLDDADAAIIIGGGKSSYFIARVACLIGVPIIPVATLRGAGEKLWQEMDRGPLKGLARMPRPENMAQLNGSDHKQVLSAIADEIAAFPRVMVVHGRSSDRIEVVEILNSIGVYSPLVLRDEFATSVTIPEKFEPRARQVDAAVVVFTPDEVVESILDHRGRTIDQSLRQTLPMARQNVALEYGWFWARLGRSRVFSLVKDGVELPSDISALEYQKYSVSPNECRAEIAAFVDSIRIH